jgi:hypothetical protein
VNTPGKYIGKEHPQQMNNLTKSRKTFIRREKSRIRRSVFDIKEQEKLISGLYPAAHQA